MKIRTTIRTGIGIILPLLLLLLPACAVFKSFMNISRTKFKMNGVSEVYLANINVMGKTRLQDFSTMEMLNLAATLSSGRMPLRLVIGIGAKNPNDGTGGYAQSETSVKSFPFRITIEGNEVARGNIDRPFVIPGTGQETVIPLSVEFDLLQMFNGRNKEDLINLVLQATGSGGRPSTLAVYAKPVISTSLGDITYPDELKIIDKEFK